MEHSTRGARVLSIARRWSASLLVLACLASTLLAGDEQVLVASQGATDDQFGGNGATLGGSMAIDGDWLAVGSERRAVAGQHRAGVVTLFIRKSGTWVEVQELSAAVPQQFGHFGCAVALRGDTLLVGERGHDAGAGLFHGAVHVFELDGGVWSERALLMAADGQVPDQFGAAVALDDGRLLVGAPGWSTADDQFIGAAYVFERQAGRWIETQRLVPDGAGDEELVGTSVALDGDRLLLGAPRWFHFGSQPNGSAYPYHLEGDRWVAEPALQGPPSGDDDDWFGLAVALVDDIALVGAPNRRVRGTPFQGAVVCFGRQGGRWVQDQLLVAPDPRANGDGFGVSLDTDGQTLAVGAMYGSPGFNGSAGKAHVFRRSTAGWQAHKTLTAPTPQPSAMFGMSVAAAGGWVVVSAPNTNLEGSINQGLAVSFDLRDVGSERAAR